MYEYSYTYIHTNIFTGFVYECIYVYWMSPVLPFSKWLLIYLAFIKKKKLSRLKLFEVLSLSYTIFFYVAVYFWISLLLHRSGNFLWKARLQVVLALWTLWLSLECLCSNKILFTERWWIVFGLWAVVWYPLVCSVALFCLYIY